MWAGVVGSLIALSVNPQWWWSTVFLPAAGGIGWLAKFWFDNRQVDRVEVREDRSEEWAHILEMNTRLSSANLGLEAKLAQFDPTLAQVQKEYRETLTREMDGLETLRDLRIAHADLELRYAESQRDAAAVVLLRQEIQMLRAFIVEKGHHDEIPKHLAIFPDQSEEPEQDTPPPMS